MSNGNGSGNGNGKKNDTPVECCPCDDKGAKNRPFLRIPGEDPRFQQQNQTLRCYVHYRDFYRCQRILGEDHEACGWFKESFETYCPAAWIERWDEQRGKSVFPGYMKDRKLS